MKTYIGNHAVFGKMLFAENGDIKLGIPLDFGIRISYLTYKDSKNLFFEQPKDMTDLATEEGWRVYGGHRLWLAPESEKDYNPDNLPISYEIFDDKIVLYQENDEVLKVKKSIEISFVDDNVVKVKNNLQNTDKEARTFSVWGVTSMDGGGTEYIPLKYGTMSYSPLTNVSMWYYTVLGDERAEYTPEMIKLTNRPYPTKYKIGVGHPNGTVKYVNHGVCFEKIFDIFRDKQYPDSNVSFETFMCDHMVEVESLSPLYEVAPNQTVSHTELWRLNKE
jgi:hypothetical protein